jgi:hypothetical protein
MRSAGWRKLILPFGSLAVVALLATLAVGCQQNPGSPIPAASTPPAQTTSAVASSQSGKATFKIKSLDVAPSEVTAGQSSTATVVVENIGAIDGTFAIALRVNGTVLDTKEVTLTPGSTKSATFAINRDSAGTYEVKVEDIVATLVVKQGTPISTPPPSTPAATIEGPVTVSFDPSPVVAVNGRVSFRVILTETKGVGVSFKNCVIQRYTASGPVGTPVGMTSPNWFQNLAGSYLPANAKGTIGAGWGAGAAYATFEFTGTDDSGKEVIANGRVDFH